MWTIRGISKNCTPASSQGGGVTFLLGHKKAIHRPFGSELPEKCAKKLKERLRLRYVKNAHK